MEKNSLNFSSFFGLDLFRFVDLTWIIFLFFIAVHAWKLINGDLVAIDLFSNSHLPKSDFENGNSDPSLYIGSYQKQLYIQESDELLLKRKYLKGGKFFDEKTGEMISAGYASHRVKWRPYLISADSRTTVINHGSKPKTNELPMLTYDSNTAENTAVSVFKHGGGNADYPYDSGIMINFTKKNVLYLKTIIM